MKAPLPSNESARLAALRACEILDTPPEREFDDITALAAAICETPVALITLVDDTRQWFKSKVGVAHDGTPRDEAFCAHALESAEPLLVRDAREDARFADNPFVTSADGFRFYAAAPLVTPTGEVLGSLCVLDRVARELTARQLETLRVLGRHVMTRLQLRRELREQEAAKQALRQSEERHRAVVESSLDAIVMMDPEGRIIEFNPAAEEMFGHARAAVLGRELSEVIVPPAMRALHQHSMQRHLATGESRILGKRLEMSALRADGTEFPVELTVTRLGEGGTLRFTGFLRDVTERKRLETLQACEARALEAVSSGLPLAEILAKIALGVESVLPGSLASVMLVDAAGKRLLTGAAPGLPAAYAAAINGVAIGEAVGSCGTAAHRGEPVIVADIRTDPLWADYRALADQHGLRACWSVPVLDKTGKALATFAVYYRAPRAPQPVELELIARLVHIAGLAIERERKDRELRLLETSISRVNDIVLITEAEPQDEPGPRILYVNDAFVRRTGYAREEVIGKTPRLLQGEKTQRGELDRIRAALKAWQPVRAELINYKKSGEEFWLELEIVPVADATGWFTHWVAVERDISERKRIEEELRRNTDLLKYSEGQYRMLFADNPLPMWVFDFTTLRFLAVNGAALAHYGYTEDEFLSLSIRDIRPIADVAPIERELRAPGAEGKRMRRSRHCKRDGTLIDVEVTSDNIEFDGRPARLVLVNDITERVRTEREAFRANRALRLLTRCNEALIRAESEKQLLTEVCQIAVDEGGFRMAWVGYAGDDAEKSIVPQAHAGVEEGYLQSIRLSWAEESPSGRGPAARAIRDGVPVFVPDITAASGGFYTVKEALAHGYCGVVCLPLKDNARAFGQLALYLGEISYVPNDELDLLRELADDVAFGILNLRARAERRRTHEAVLAMARGVSASTGAEFFEKLLHSMVEALGAHAGFIAQALPGQPETMRTLCSVAGGRTEANFDYALAGSPCAELSTNDSWMLARGAHRDFPQAALLVERKIEGYAGVRLSLGPDRPLGLLAVQFQQPVAAQEFVSSSLKIFAARVSAEFQRQESEARTREQAALLDKAQDAIVVTDLAHRITYWNKSAERRYGWAAAEALGRSARELLYTDRESFDAAVAAVHAHGEWTGEFVHSRKDGQRLNVEGHWTLVRDDAGRPKSVLAINTDITERKRLEQQFLRAQRMESIGTLAGGIAHDLNNLLAPITMGVELLRRFEVNPKSLMLIDNMERSARRGADLVKQVLSFARGVEGSRVALHVRHIIREVESIAENTFPKNIMIETDVTDDLWLVLADPTQLNQVLLNLCVNARDAMPDGGSLAILARNAEVDVQYAVMNHGVAAGHYVLIQVTDSGCGMPQPVIDRIFEPFFTTKELGKGTGLGLSTVLGIVRSHGGFVNVYSEPGKGSVFKVYLPAQVDGTLALPAEAAPEKFPRGRDELILVVDDEKSILDVTKQTLQTFGYRVLTAEDGAQAIGLYALHREEIALVLTDMMMPVMDGPALIAALRRVNPRVRLVAASGLNANGNVVRAATSGVKHFLAKPYSADALLTTIKEVLTEGGSRPPM